jgi:hypothetical protein
MLIKSLTAAIEMAAYLDPDDVARGLSCGGFDGLMTERLLKVRKIPKLKIRDLSEKYA